MNVALKTNRFFICPNGCPDEFYVEHLFKDLEKPFYDNLLSMEAGPWYCDHRAFQVQGSSSDCGAGPGRHQREVFV